MDLCAQIVAALSGAPTQNQRLVKLHTVLGPDVLLAERVEIEEHIGPGPAGESALHADADAAPAAGTRLVVQALSLDAHLELKRLIGQPALVELLTQASRTELRPWHGHVTRAELLGSDGGLARYRLTIEPWLAFLGQTRDAWVFQDRSVPQIVEEVFADYRAQGKLAPSWRWELADAGVYPQRSLCIQYQESDLAFVWRLMREEGLHCWFEHAGDASAAGLGSHTLVIADHNGAFRPNAQPRVRYTQSQAGFQADSLTRWQRSVHVRTASLALASPDYRSLSLRPVSQHGMQDGRRSEQDNSSGDRGVLLASLSHRDIPGVYAYEDSRQGERLARRQMQAIDALRERVRATSNVRSTAPATTFTLCDHPVHDGSDAERDRFVVLGAQHRARNNLSADQKAHLDTLLGAIRRDNVRNGDGRAAARAGQAVGHTAEPAARQRSGHETTQDPSRAASGTELANATDEPLYVCELLAQRAAVPVRIAATDEHGQPDPRIHPRPTVHGVQGALVVGLDAPVHTDRDHRIKVQFHWQRGANSSHRLTHPAGPGNGDNAPASDASGTWVRVGESVAGANWGMNFVPRLGQEVLVAFVEGDIDRPVVIGSSYNGAGRPDAQGNQVAAGAAGATGNAPAWFPGNRTQGRLQGHQHTAVLAGFKSQELGTSRSGEGGYNQLVFDDTPGAGRIELSSTTAATRLQLGHLLQQTDNQRLQTRGHGIDLTSQAWGAVRAGSGLLVSAHGKPGSQGAGAQLDSREPRASLEQAASLVHMLAESSHKQNARLEGDPNLIGATASDKSRQLAVEQAQRASSTSWGTTGAGGTLTGTDSHAATGGGNDTDLAAWSRPDLVVAAPGGIASFTPAGSVYGAGNTLSLVAAQDIQHLAQANLSMVNKEGLVIYAHGKTGSPTRPNQETGIRLHAASGSVETRSQSGSTRLTADKRIDVSSTTARVLIAAPGSILMTAGGAALDLQAGGITLKGPGKIEFKAAMKVIEGP